MARVKANHFSPSQIHRWMTTVAEVAIARVVRKTLDVDEDGMRTRCFGGTKARYCCQSFTCVPKHVPRPDGSKATAYFVACLNLRIVEGVDRGVQGRGSL